MINITKYISIHPLTLALFAVSLYMGIFIETAFIFGIIFLHELAHFLAAKILGESPKQINIMPYGCSLATGKIKNDKKAVLIYLAGPLLNLFFMLFARHEIIFNTNLTMLLVNMLPIYPLDGGNILNIMLKRISPYYKKISFFLGLFTLIFLAYYSYKTIYITPYPLIALLFLTNAFFAKQDEKYISLMRRIIESHNENELKFQILSAYEGESLSKVLAYAKKGSSLLVHVLDKKGKKVGVLTEGEIINAIPIMGKKAKLKDLLNTVEKRGNFG